MIENKCDFHSGQHVRQHSWKQRMFTPASAAAVIMGSTFLWMPSRWIFTDSVVGAETTTERNAHWRTCQHVVKNLLEFWISPTRTSRAARVCSLAAPNWHPCSSKLFAFANFKLWSAYLNVNPVWSWDRISFRTCWEIIFYQNSRIFFDSTKVALLCAEESSIHLTKSTKAW